MLFDDSSDESFGLFGEFIDLLWVGDDSSEGDIFQLSFVVFVGNKYDVIRIEDDSFACFFWEFEFELPSTDFDVLV